MNRVFRLLRPSHQHTAFSATLLLMTAVLLSRVIGYIREAYIAWAFGAGPATDAYVAGFTIPDWLNYLVAGGTASITFVSIYTRFLAENREEDAQQSFWAGCCCRDELASPHWHMAPWQAVFLGRS